MNQLRCSFKGRVKVDKKDGFGLFVMDTKDVCAKLAQPLRNLNDMILKRAGSGKVIMCQFENYAGRYQFI